MKCKKIIYHSDNIYKLAILHISKPQQKNIKKLNKYFDYLLKIISNIFCGPKKTFENNFILAIRINRHDLLPQSMLLKFTEKQSSKTHFR